MLCVGGAFGQNSSQYPAETGNYSAVVRTTGQGGQDRFEVAFFEIPSSITSDLYFAVKGASQINSVPDENTGGTTTFYVIGGTGAYSSSDSKQTVYSDTSYLTGTPLKAFAVSNLTVQTGTDTDSGLTLDAPLDTSGSAYATTPNQLPNDHTTWVYFPAVNATQGELIGSNRYFKVVAVKSTGGTGNQKNAFQLDVSLLSPDTDPREVPGAYSFSYSRMIGAYDATAGGTWNIHPFVPSGATGNIEFYNFDMDLTESLYWENIDATRTGGPMANLSDDAEAQNDIAITLGEGSDTKGTWVYRVVETASAQNPNPLEVWVENNGEPLKLYSNEIDTADVPDPYRVVMTTDSTTVTAGSTVDVNMQIVDSSGDPVDYRYDIYVEAQDTNAAGTPVISPDTTTVADDTEVITTDADGSATFTLTESDDGDSVTIVLWTDGDNSSDDFGIGTDDEITITFAANPTPTIESLGDTTVEEAVASPSATLQRIVIEDQGTIDLTDTDTDDFSIRIDNAIGVNFVNTAPTISVFASGGGAGTGVIASAGSVGNVFSFNITTDLAAGDYITIDDLQIDTSGASVTSDQALYLELDYDDDGTWDATDTRTITVTDADATTYTYIGTDGDWTTAANWSPSGPPADGDSVIISPTASSGFPLQLPATVTSLVNVTIQGDAYFDLNGNDLTVTTTFSNDGYFMLQGGETVSITNDTDSGTVVYTGSAGMALGNSYYNLSINSAGTVTPGGALDVNGDLTLTAGTLGLGAVAMSVAGDIVQTAGDISSTGTVTLDGTGDQNIDFSGSTLDTVVLDKAGGTANFSSGFTATDFSIGPGVAFDINLNTDTAQAMSITNAVVFDNTGTLAFGDDGADSCTFTGGMTVSGPSSVSYAGTLDTVNSPLAFSNPIVLTADTEFDSGTGTLTFNAGATVDGQYDLTLTSTGVITIGDVMGGGTPLASLSSSGSQTRIGADITTQGNTITFTTPVVITTDTTLTDTDTGIYFESTVDGDGDNDNLTLTTTDGASSIEFQDVVGTTALGSLTVNNAGTFEVWNTLTVTNNIDQNDNGTGDSVDIANTFTSTAGTIDFESAVTTGGDIDAASGSLTFNDAVTVDADVTLSSGGGSAATFTSTITGSAGTETLTVDSSDTNGTADIQGAVSSLGSFTVTAGTGQINVNNITAIDGNIVLTGSNSAAGGNDIQFNGTTITSTGTGGADLVDINGDVLLAASVTITGAGGAGDDIDFSSVVEGAQTLTIDAGANGDVTFNAAVGGGTALTGFDIDSASDISLQAVTTANGIIQTGNSAADRPALLELNDTLTSEDGGAAGAITLHADEIAIIGAGPGTILIDSDGTADGTITVTTAAANGLNSDTAWADGVTFNSGTAATVLTGATLLNLDHLDISADSASLGDVTLGDGLGNGSVGLDVNTTGDLTLTGDITMSDGTTTNAGAVELGGVGGDILLDDNVTIDTDAAGTDADITLWTVEDNAGDWNLELTAGTGDITLSSTVGTTDRIGTLDCSGNDITINGNIESTAITLTGSQNGADDESINIAAVTLDANGSGISLAADDIAINAAASLSSTGAGGDGSGVDVLCRAEAAASTIGIGSAATAAVLDLSEAELQTVAATFDEINIGASGSQSGTITINDAGGLTGLNTGLRLIARTADVDIDSDVTLAAGRDFIVDDEAQGNTTTVSASTVSTSAGGDILIGDNLELDGGADSSFTTDGAGAVSLGGTTDGPNGLDITAGTGGTTITGAVGGVTALDNFSIVQTAALTLGQAVTTDGATGVVIDINNDASLTVNAAINTSAGPGVITLDADNDCSFGAGGDLTSGGLAINVTADSDGDGSGGIAMNAGSAFTSGAAQINLNAYDDVTLGDLVSTDNVSVTATFGSINEAGTGDAGVDIQAVNLTLTARDEIGGAAEADIETTVSAVSAGSTNAGDIVLTESNAVTLTSIDTNNGAITITAGGAVTATLVDSSNTNADANDISITTSAGNIAVTEVLGGAGQDNDVTLNAAAAVTDASGGLKGITGDVLDADAAGAITIDTDVAEITADTSAAGDITVTEDDAVTLTSVTTTDGAITVSTTNAGDLTVTTVTAADAGADETHDVTLTVVNGDMLLDAVTADNLADLSADAGTITDSNGEPATNITAINLDISAAGAAGTGIGTITDFATVTGDAIEVTLSGQITNAATTVAGSTINIDQTGDMTINAGVISIAGGNQGEAIITASGDIDAGGAASVALTGDDSLALVSGGTLTIPDAGFDAGTGDLRMTGTTDIIDSGTSPRVLVLASDDLNFSSGDAGADTTLTSTVNTLTASLTGAGSLTVNETNAITLTSIDTTNGAITVSAGGAVTATLVDSSNTNADANGISITTSAGNIAVTEILGGAGQANDVTLNAAAAVTDAGGADPDITGDVLTIDADSGIGSGAALETSVGSLDLDNATSGNIEIAETNAVTIANATQATTGNISITTTNGTITADSGGAPANVISTLLTGTITLDANGAAADLAVNDGISNATGTVTLAADNDISFAAEGDLTSTSGAVTFTADADNGGAASGALTMSNDALVNAGSGTIAVTADEDITIGGLQTTDGSNTAVVITSREGAVVDGGVAHTDVAAAGRLVIDAVSGIGSGDALETSVASLDLDNATIGNIEISETNAVTIANATQATTGNISISTANGLLSIDGAVSAAGAGNVILAAGGAGNDIDINAAINGGTGSVTITPVDTIFIGANVTTVGDAATDDITFAGTAVLTDSGTWAVSTGAGLGDIIFSGTLDATTGFDEDLTFTAGTGSIDFQDAVGVTNDLGDIDIVSALNVTTDANGFRADTLQQQAGTGTTTFNGPVIINDAGAGAGTSLAITTANADVNSTVTTLNDGTATFTIGTLLDVAAGADMSLAGAFTQNGAGAVQTAGDITTTNDDISFAGDVTLSDSHSVAMSSGGGAGDITFTGTLDATTDFDEDLTLTAGTGSIDFQDAVGVTNDLGDIDIVSALNVTTDANGFRADTLQQQAGTGTTTFNGPVVINDAGAGAGTSLAITTANADVNSTVTTLNDGTATFTIGTLLDIAAAGDMSLAGAFTQNGAGAVQTAGDITTTNDDISFAGDVTLTDSALSMTTGAGIGDISFNSTLGGGQDLSLTAGTGTITFADAVGGTAIGDGTGAALTIVSGATTFQSTLQTNSGISIAPAVEFQDDVTIGAGNTATTLDGNITLNGLSSFNAGRSVDFGDDPAADAVTLSAGPVSIATTANNGDLTFDSTINGAQILTLTTNGTGEIYLNGDVGTGTNLTGFTANAAIINLAADVDIDTSATNGTITFHVDGQLLGGNNSIDAGGGIFQIYPQTATEIIEYAPTNDVAIAEDVYYESTGFAAVTAATYLIGDATHTGAIHVGNTEGGVTSVASLEVQNGGVGATIYVEEDYDSSADNGSLTLTSGSGGITLRADNASLNITLGAGSFIAATAATLADNTNISASGGINFQSTLDGTTDYTEDLTLAAGAGNIDFDGIVGGTTDLGDIQINSAANVTADAAVSASSLTQSAGSGTTLFSGDVTTVAAAGVNITAAAIALDNATMQVDSSGNGLIRFNGPVELRGAATTLDTTGTGDITFTNTLDSQATENNTLTLGGDTGDILFTGAVGATQPLGTVTIDEAVNVTFSSTAEAASITQTTGSGTTLFSNDVTTTAAAGVNITATAIALDNATMQVDSSGNGLIRFNGPVELRGTATTLDTTGTGEITFTNTLNSQATENNTLTLGGDTGDILFTGAVGATQPLGTVTIDEAVNVTFSSTAAAASITQTTGSGTTLFSDDVTTTAAAGVNITATAIALDNATMQVASSGNGLIRFNGPVELRGAATTLDTVGTGDITFTGTLDSQATENNTLTLGGGTGDILFTGAVGATQPLGAVTIDEAVNVTFSSTAEAASITQTTGSGTTLFSDDVTTTAATGVNITANAIALDNATMQVASTGNGLIRFNGPVELRGAATTLDTTGTGEITFTNTLNSQATENNTLTLGGDTGDILFTGAVGATQPLGTVTIDEAVNVTFSSTAEAASITQTAGSGTTLFSDDVTTTAAAGVNITATAIALDNITMQVASSGNGLIRFNGPVELRGAATTLDTTGTGDITFTNTLDSQATENNTLTLGGDTGDIMFTGAVGGTQPLGAVNIDEAVNVTFNSTTAAASITETTGSGTTLFSDDVTTTAAAGVNITATAIALDNITMQVASSGNGLIRFNGPVELRGAATTLDTTGTGNITFTNTLDSQATENNTLTLGGDTGDILFTGAVGGTQPLGAVTIDEAVNVTFNSTTAAASITQTTGSGTTLFSDDVTTTAAAGVNITANAIALDNATMQVASSGNGLIRFNGPVELRGAATTLDTTGTGDITFTNTLNSQATENNTLTLGGDTGDILFTGAVGATQPLGAVTIDEAVNVTFNSTAEAASITQTTGSGTTLFSDDVTTTAAAGVNITATAIALDNATMQVSSSGNGLIRFNGPVELRGAATTLDTTGTGDITFTNTLDSQATENNTLTLGGDTGDILFTGAVGGTHPLGAVTIDEAVNVTFNSTTAAASITQTTGSGTTLFSDDVTTTAATGVNITTNAIALDNATMQVASSGNGLIRFNGPVELRGAATTLDTTGTGNITFTNTLDSQAAENNTLTLGGDTGDILFTGAVGGTQPLGAVTIDEAVDVTFSSTAEAASITQTTGSGTTLFSDDVTTTAATGVNITTNAIALDNAAMQVASSGNGLIRFNGPVELRGAATTLDTTGTGDITFTNTLDSQAAENNTLTLGGDTGDILFTGAVGATQPLGTVTIDEAVNVTFSSTAEAASITQTAGSGDTQFDGAVVLEGAGGMDITTNTVTLNNTIDTATAANGGTVTITNAGLLDIAAAADMSLDGAFLQDGAGSVQTAGDITTTADDITFQQDVTLTDDGTVSLSTGAGVGGSIAFNQTLDGDDANFDDDLTLTAGTGSIDFDGIVGGTNDVGDILINSAADVTADAAVSATTITQSAGSGDTQFDGAVVLEAVGGMNITTSTVTLNSTIDTATAANGGPVTITNAGLLDIAAAADMSLDGAFTQNGAGSVQTAGDITTTNDNISFLRDITIDGDLTIDSGAAGGNITFDDTIDGGNILTIDAGTGTLNINDVVGGITPLDHVRLHGAGNFNSTAALLDLRYQDLYIAADGYTIVLLLDIRVNRLVFYSGTLDLNGNTITAPNDFVAYGSSYDDQDGQRTTTPGANTYFAYPDEAGLLMPMPGTLDARFADMDGSTIDVSSNGNFYLNGANINNGGADNSGNWDLIIRDNSGSTDPGLDTNPGNNATDWPFGSIYAAAFNADVDHCQASGGTVMADTENGMTDGNNNSNWDFARPTVTSFETIFDNVLRVTFSEAIENTNDEINNALAAAAADSGIKTDTGGTKFTLAYVDDDGTPDAPPYNFTTTDGEGDLTTFYLFVPRATLTWNTDATGTTIGNADNGSSDRDGVHQTTVPDITMLKGVLFDAAGHNLVQNYGENGIDECDGDATEDTGETFTDECRPALIAVAAGQADHQLGGETYDAHNMFHLRYSENVNIGTDADFQIGAAAPADNVRVEETFDEDGEWGGYIYQSGSDVAVEGYFTYPGTFNSGSKDGNDAISAVFRESPENPSGDYGLTIYVAGYRAANTDPFPGYLGIPTDTLASHTPNTDPSSSSEQAYVPANTRITDAGGNVVEPSSETYRSFSVAETVEDPTITDDISDMAPNAVAGLSMPAVHYDGWEVDTPVFSVYIAGSTPSYEMVTRADIATGLVNKMEFFIRDNENEMTLWDPDNDHVDSDSMHGIRDTSYESNFGLVPYEAFKIEDVNVTELTNAHNAGFSTFTDNSLFSSSSPAAELVDVEDDSYFTLNINNFGHSWDALTALQLSYDADVGYITDLAGNLLPSTGGGVLCVERIPPVIDLALASVDDDKVYIQFSEPVFGAGATALDASNFNLSGGTLTFTDIEVISYLNGGVMEAWLSLSDNLDADTAVEGRITANADEIYDKISNPMSATSAHRITDIGIGVMVPVWAQDSIHNDNYYGGDDNSLREFDGTGYLTASNITVEASIAADSYADLSTGLYYDVDPSDSVVSDGLWLPTYNNALVPEGNSEARHLNAARAESSVRDFVIPSEDSEIENGNTVEFLLHLGDLICARLIDEDDPRTLMPWSFTLKDVKQQASGVTILNNIINPTQGERAILNYNLEESGMVVINVFNLGGDLVDVIHRGAQGVGNYTYSWDGTNRAGTTVARGVYFIRIVGPDIDEFRKVMVVK